MRGTARCLTDVKYHFPPSGRTFLTGASVWASLHFCILVRHMIGLMLRRGVRAGRRSSPAKRVYGLKPVSRVQISPSPPHTQVKRRVTDKGNSPFLRLNGVKWVYTKEGLHKRQGQAPSLGRFSDRFLNNSGLLPNQRPTTRHTCDNAPALTRISDLDASASFYLAFGQRRCDFANSFATSAPSRFLFYLATYPILWLP